MENINIIAYCIYLLIGVGITVFVGKHLHKNGYYLILDLFDNEVFTKTLNLMLLVGYYLVNIGYISMTITTFNHMENAQDVFEAVGEKVGLIFIILGLLHVNNILVLSLLSKRKENIIKLLIN